MKVKCVFGLIVITLLALGSGSTPSAKTQIQPASALQLLDADEQSVLLELTVDGFEVEAIEVEGETYHRLHIPDTTQITAPGSPQLPTRGTLIGVPSDSDLSRDVLEAEYEVLSGYRMYPAPSIEADTSAADSFPEARVEQVFYIDKDVYSSSEFLPQTPVEIHPAGKIRDQAVAQVQFYPAQYNPHTGELRLYRRLVARITWDAPTVPKGAATSSPSPVFENLLENTLLNFETLDRPAVVDRTHFVYTETGVAATLAPTDTLKIGVTEDGLYELTYNDIVNAGMDLSGVDPRTIKLSNQGSEVPILVLGQADAVFDTTDRVLFYGTAITDIFTLQNVYWLTASGSEGLRMDARNAPPAGAPVPSRFPVALHAEEDTHYWLAMPNGEGKDHWFWEDRISPNTSGLPQYRDYSMSLNNISTDVLTATVRVRLQGFTALDHHTKIYLNGHEIDEQTWSGQVVFDHEVVVDHALLVNGNNTVRVEAVDAGAAVDQTLVNWIEIDYWDTFVAEDDELVFGVPEVGPHRFEVKGFTSNDVEVYDVTNPADVAVITDTNVVFSDGAYVLQFQEAVQSDTRYRALVPDGRKSPSSIAMDSPSAWKSPMNGADYIIIAHDDFYTSTLALASHRAATSGLRVVTVKEQDIYDEFNYGVFNPEAIRDFLSYAYQNWEPPAPTYVLLVGDATYDYRGLLGRTNYVPTVMIETDLLGQTPTDNWFVAVSGDDILPDMFIGRLPARSVSQVDTMVDKIISYELQPLGEPWHRNVVFTADDDETSFEFISEQLAGITPYYYSVNKVFVGDYPPGDPTADIAQQINAGSILVNYAGHGNVDTWGVWSGGRIFDNADVGALNNSGKYPVVTVANCLNGFFVGAKTSMAETFLTLEDKGALAAWAPTGLGYPAGHRTLIKEFYEAVFHDDQYDLGAATTTAKIVTYAQSGFWADLVETFVLFGDPATRLAIADNYPYVDSTSPSDGATSVPIDQEITIKFNKQMLTDTVVLGGGGTAGLPLEPVWDPGSTFVRYAHSDFEHGQTLTFSVSGDDHRGDPLEPGPVPTTWSFTVTTDAVPPGGTISVGDGSLDNVPLDGKVIVAFSEAVRTGSIAYTMEPNLYGRLNWYSGNEMADYAHPGFEPGATYTFTVITVKDLAGNALPEPLQVVFTAESTRDVFLPVFVRNP